MKISELIEILKEAKSTHGDIQVELEDNEFAGCSDPCVGIIEVVGLDYIVLGNSEDDIDG